MLTFCPYHRLKQNWKQLHCLKCRFLFSMLSTFQKSLSDLFSTFFVEILEFPQIVLFVFHCFHIFCDPMKAAKFGLHTFYVFHLFCGFVTYTFNWFIISMLFVELWSFHHHTFQNPWKPWKSVSGIFSTKFPWKSADFPCYSCKGRHYCMK